MKARDDQQLREGYWESKREQWDADQNSDEHAHRSGEDDVKQLEDKVAHFDKGYLEAGCAMCLIRAVVVDCVGLGWSTEFGAVGNDGRQRGQRPDPRRETSSRKNDETQRRATKSKDSKHGRQPLPIAPVLVLTSRACVDMWSCGVLAFTFALSFRPFVVSCAPRSCSWRFFSVADARQW